MEETRPGRGGARDFAGRVTPEYSPQLDGDPDPGEIVWTWVPYEEDPDRGKDRPVVVVGRAADDARLLVGLMLTSKDHDGDARWHRIGAGSWDGEHRPSWVRVDRPLAVAPDAVRREGAILDPAQFLAVVERAVGQVGAARTGRPRGGVPRRVVRLVGVHGDHAASGSRIAEALRRLGRSPGCALCGLARSSLRRRPEWHRMVAALGVPVEIVDYDARDASARRLVPTPAAAPTVLADVGGQLVLLLAPAELERLSGDVAAFGSALHDALRRRSLSLG